MAVQPKPRGRTIATPIDLAKIKAAKPGGGEAGSLLLGEYLAAVRRELETVALIAASEDPAVPQFHIADIEIEMSYGIEEVTDAGVRIITAQGKLAELPEALLHRVKVRMVDPAVRALPTAPGGDER